MTSTEYQPETVTLCPHCDDEIDADDLGPSSYECGACGTQFTSDESNRCPDCNRFAAKLADASCPQCDEPVGGECGDLEERQVYRSADGETHDTPEAAAAWDDPAATAARETAAAASQARAYDLIAEHTRKREARTDRLKAALALSTTPRIGYYHDSPLHEPPYDSTSAYVTPDELRAICGGGNDEAVEARLAEQGGGVPWLWQDSVRCGINVEVLVDLLERLAG